jgi:hypothetical protein
MRKRSWTDFKPVAMNEPLGNPHTEMFKNATHTVIVSPVEDGDMSKWVLLSIRRNDRAAERDWRVFQRIKNLLVGSEREAVELYPAQSRLVDSANQYHLWVSPAGHSFQIGYTQRDVAGAAVAASHGAAQREFDDGDPLLEGGDSIEGKTIDYFVPPNIPLIRRSDQ